MNDMRCPRCGFVQPPAEECARCGVLVRKALERPIPPLVSPHASAAPATTGGGGWLLLIVVLFGAAAGLYFLPRLSRPGAITAPLERTARRHGASASAPAASGAAERPESPATRWGPPPEETPFAPPTPTPVPLELASSRAPVSDWYEGADGYRQAVEESRRYGKPLAVYFHTDWCGFCRRMESEIFSASETRDYFERLSKVRINPEHGREEAALAHELGARGYPTFLIIRSPGGGGIRVHPFLRDGTMTPSEFVSACRAAGG